MWDLFSFPTDEMKTFAGQQIEPLFQFSWLVVFLTLLLCGSVALVLGFTVDHKLAIAVSLSLLGLLYIFFGETHLLVGFCGDAESVIRVQNWLLRNYFKKIIEILKIMSLVLVYFGSRRERESWNWAWIISTRLARQIGYLELLLKLMFVNPPELPEQTTRALPVRWHWYPDAYVIQQPPSLIWNVFGWLSGWFVFFVHRTGSCSRIIIVCPVLEGRPPWLKWSPCFQMPVKENLALWLPGSSEFSKKMRSKVGPLMLALPCHDFHHDLIRCWLTNKNREMLQF